MRVGEAVRLDRDDVDWDEGVLTVWESKFGKMPGDPAAPQRRGRAQGLRAAARPAVSPPRDGELLRLPAGERLVYNTVQATFSRIVRDAGVGPRPAAAPSPPSRPAGTPLPAPPAGLVPGRRRRRGAPAAAVHLPRARQSRRPPTGTCPRSPSCWPWRPGGATSSGGAGMSALAPTLEAFFTERLVGQRHASPHTIAAYRDAWRLLLRFVRDQAGKEPCQLDLADLDASADRSVPGPPGAGAGQQCPHPQRPPGRHPLVLPLRRAPPPRARRPHRPRPGHPGQALPADRGLLPDPARARSPAGRSRPGNLDRAAGPRPARRRRPDRSAGLRAHRPAQPGHRARPRRARPVQGQGQEGPVHAPDQENRGGPESLDARTRRQPQRPALPRPPRHPTHPPRGRRPGRQAHHHRHRAMSVAARPSTRHPTSFGTAVPWNCCAPGSTSRSSRCG